jgi:hypothetical protein
MSSDPASTAGESTGGGTERHSIAEGRPVPACRERYVESRDWTAKTYTDSLAQFYRPCRWPECYPHDGSPDIGDRVIRVTDGRQATVVHRPGEHPDRDDETERAAPDEQGGHAGLDMADAQPLSSVAALNVGDGVAWPAREQPLFVDATEWPLEPEVTLTGPAGGTYTLRERDSGEIWIYPRYAYVEDVFYLPADTPASE